MRENGVIIVGCRVIHQKLSFYFNKEGINHVPCSHEFERGPNILLIYLFIFYLLFIINFFIICPSSKVLVSLHLLCDLIIMIISSWYFNTS